MHSNSSSSFSARSLLATAAIVGLSASSVVSAAPAANGTTFGTVTSGNNKCVVGDPSEYISTRDVDWIWDNRIGPNVKPSATSWSVLDNKNWIMDHIVKNQGSLNYLRDASLLDWNDDSLGKIYEGDLDGDGVPKCPQSCYRFYDVGINGWSDTSGCTTEPFDLSLWPKDGLDGGMGYDWGQEINQENMMQTLDNEELHIISHEIGHGFGLPDFYEKSEIPSDDFPACIMEAGRSMTVTPGDGWMLRRILEHLKPRYNF
eukprot:jgi/Phyca11/13998/fgenesh1_pg.PHYCAscaffold_5_\